MLQVWHQQLCCVHILVCLMALSGTLSTGNLLNVSAVFSLLGMCLILYLNCYMYSIHLWILAEGGFECGSRTVTSGLWSVQISNSFPWMYRKKFSQPHFTGASLSN